jgi:transposase
MDIMYERCCGLDVHKQTVVACVLEPGSGRQPKKEIRTFGTMTADLLQLGDWLTEKRVTHVALESTGVYWHAVWNLLEGQVGLLLVNARHIKQVPGRKTDVRDCEWIANLLRHGLLRASFVPDRPQRELRELTRYRTALVRERAAEVNRIQKTLEGANVKLGDVASDILGVSARRMLEALISGTTDPAALADLAVDKLRSKVPQLERALNGQFGAHHRFLLGQQLKHLDGLDELIERVGGEISERVRPVEQVVERIDAMPGFGRRTAEIVVAEIGIDLSRFPSFKHLASWVGLCPGNDESAGKRRSGKTRRGNVWLRSALIEAAHAASRSKDTYLAAHYHRIAARRGKKKAIVALAHTLLTIVYYLITRDRDYDDLGAEYLDQHDREHTERRLIRRLESFGYTVTRAPAA